MVQDNAAHSKSVLETAFQSGDEQMKTLEKIAPILLEMLLSARAILLNRVATSAPTGDLGTALPAGGRDVIGPLVGGLIDVISKGKDRALPSLSDVFFGALIGDLQIKRVIGAMPVPTPQFVQARSHKALDVLEKALR